MDANSPPLTPIRNYMSPLETSPSSASSYRQHYLRRRTSSSFSSPNDARSPASNRNSHRFSNASRYSNDLPTPGDERHSIGLGNLADELDQVSDGEDYEEGNTTQLDETFCDAPDERDAQQGGAAEASRSAEGARDSGVDVSYTSPASKKGGVPNFSKPFAKPPDVVEDREAEAAESQEAAEAEEPLSRELEEAMTAIARMASQHPSTTAADPDPLIPRFVASLQDLGNQTSLEASSQRLTTSTNSLTNYLNAQTKTLATLAAGLCNPFYTNLYSAPRLDPEVVGSAVPLIDALVKDLPGVVVLPSSSSSTTAATTTPLQGLQKLSRDTAGVVQSLGGLTDSLQMGKQSSASAARLLRSCQGVVEEMRRERERAEAAREALAREGALDVGGVERRRCGRVCSEVLGGFEERCEGLRRELVAAAGGS